ncbi:MAG TPA: 5-formyltetrahydrofolate cyclo-ligase [Thermodesulfobacteriota bacterium]
MDARDAKETLRRRLLAARAALAPQDASRLADAAQAALVAHVGSRRVVALYAAIGAELPTGRAHAALASRGVTVVYPLVTPGRPRLSFHAVDDPEALLPRGRYRIPSPDPARHPEVPLEAIDLVVVPGIAYDRSGMRLGYGAGYYDRTVAGLAPTRLAGLGYGLQLVDAIPREPHDLTLGAVVTEAGVIFTEATR